MLTELLLAAVVTVDFTQPAGPVKPLHGVNNCPIRLGSSQDEFRDAGIPFCRLHDTGGMFGCGAFVDIPNVFPDFEADEDDPSNYYFNYTDKLLEPLVAAGTEPFYRLGVTIENAWATCKPRRNLPPKDFAKWARVCEHVIRHYTEGWANGYRWKMRYWEIWNEPEGEGCWQGTQAEFNELYCVAAKHLKAKFPHLKIGGPGTIGFYSIDDPTRIPWHDDLLAYQNDFFAKIRAEKAPLDFYAWHLYTDEPDRIARHAEYGRALLDRNGYAETESFLDEWNYPHRDWDGMKEAKGAAFVASAFCLMQQGPVDKAMYYDAQPTRVYCGLFYYPNGKTTPCYESFRKWNALYQDRSSCACAFPSNGVYAAASSGEGKRHILLVNYGIRSRRIELRVVGASPADFGVACPTLELKPNEVRLLESPCRAKAADAGLFSLPAIGVTNVVGEWRREVPEGRHVAIFSQRIQIEQNPNVRYVMDLGDMRGKAKVTIGAQEYPVLWRPPYCLDVTRAVRRGRYGRLETTIEVTPPDPSVEPALSTNVTVRAVAGEPPKPFGEWPDGKDPATVAGRLVGQFLSTTPWGYFPEGYGGSAPYSPDHIAYPIASFWVNALDCARRTGDIESERKLVAAFEPVYGPRKDIQTEVNHVDFTIFGAVPLAIYSKTGDRRALDLGLRYADFQFAKPDPPFKPAHDPNSPERQMELWKLGLSHQSRLWLDDLYMISLLQFEAYRATGDRKYLDRAAQETAYYIERLQREDGLFDHATGVPFVWGRGAGWGAASMAMALELLPDGDPLRDRILPRYLRMMEALKKHQRASGLWGQLVDDAASWDETSGSAMYAYAFVTGVRHGWLPADDYAERATRAYLALVDRLDEHGNLKGVCVGTNRKNSRDWYMNRPTTVGDVHGQAAMLWVCNALLAPFAPAGAAAGEYPVCNAEVCPERQNDMVWENDKFGVRAYGPGEYHKWSGFDVFNKNTASNVCIRWCHDPVFSSADSRPNFHQNLGEGMDNYTMGASRGVGGVAIFADGEWKTYPDWESSRVIHTGPDSCEFELVYPAAFGAGRMTCHITLKRGERFFRNDVTFEKGFGGDYRAGPGLDLEPSRDHHGSLVEDREAGFVSLFEDPKGEAGGEGSTMSAILVADPSAVEWRTDHTNCRVLCFRKSAFTYWAGASWSLAGEITTPEQWHACVRAFARKIRSGD